MAALQLFVSFIFLLCVSPSLALNHISVEEEAVHKKVNLSLYYEALCPYCENFIVNELVDVFRKDLIPIVNLRLVPWGNAELSGDGKVFCQHGQFECILNTLQACALSIWTDVKKHFGMIRCIEKAAIDKQVDNVTLCFGEEKDWQRVKKCYKSGVGFKLLLQHGQETAKLHPPLEFVPWVVVNDKPLKEDYGNFLSSVCRSYKGPSPQGCKTILKTSNRFEKASPAAHLCYGKNANASASPAY